MCGSWSSWIQQSTSNAIATTRNWVTFWITGLQFNQDIRVKVHRDTLYSTQNSFEKGIDHNLDISSRLWFVRSEDLHTSEDFPVSPQQLWMSLKPSTPYSACPVIFTQAWPCYSTFLKSSILSSWARNRSVSARRTFESRGKLLRVCFGYWSLSITLVESQIWPWEESHHSGWSPTLQFTFRKHGPSSTQWLPFPRSSRQRQFWEGQSHPKCSWHVRALIIKPNSLGFYNKNV